MCLFNNRVLKAYLHDKYGIKVARTKGGCYKYYTLSDHGDMYGPDWGPTLDTDDYGSILSSRLFNKISDIIDVLDQAKDLKKEFRKGKKDGK